MALTTTAILDTYLGAEANAYSAGQKAAAVARSQALIERECDRNFDAADYREWTDGTGTAELAPRDWPIIKVYRVYVGYQDAIRLDNTSTDNVNWTYHIHAGTLYLNVDGGTNDGTSELTLSSSSTLTLLATAIAALSKGWSTAITSGLTNGNPLDLRPGSGDGSLYLPAHAVGYDIAGKDRSTLHRNAGWSRGVNNVFLNYRAGYESGSIPADLEYLATAVAVALLHKASRDDTLQSERIGDYSYTIASTAERQALAPFATELHSWRRSWL